MRAPWKAPRLPDSVRLAGAKHFAFNRCALSRDAHVVPIGTRAHMALA